MSVYLNSNQNLIQALNTISTPGGIGLPVTSYAQEMQRALQLQLTVEPQSEISAYQNQTQALNSLETALQSLQSATNTLAASQNWNTVTATSSNPSSFTVTTSSGAQPSTYSINIQSLAQNQYDVSSAIFTSTSATITTGSFTLQPTSGTAVTITVGSTNDTLQGLVQAINQDTSSTNIQAGAIYNGSGYLLTLSSSQTGQAYSFSVSGSASTQFGLPVTATVAAANAFMTVDNVQITSQTNTFVNPIPNVTVNAQSTGTGSLFLSSNPSSAVSAVQTWMNAYNQVIDQLNQDTSYTPSSNGQSGQSGPLFNDAIASSLTASLPNAAMQSVTNSLQANLSSLASIGIVLNPQNGHLEFQPASGFGVGSSNVTLTGGQTTFQNAFTSNSQAVEQLFGVIQNNSLTSAISNSGVLGNLSNLLNTYLLGSGSNKGALQGDLNSIQQQQTSVQNYLTLINQQISTQVSNFTTQLNSLNAAMAQSQAQMSQLSALIGNGPPTTIG